MKAILENVSPIKKKVVVTVTKEEVAESKRRLYNILKEEVAVDGFRKGKAPEDTIIKFIGFDAYRSKLIRQIADDTYGKAIQETKAVPISDPEIVCENKLMEGEVVYDAIFEIVPVQKAKDYKGINLVKNTIAITDNDVEREVLYLQRSLMQLEPAPEGKIEDGMIALIQYKGTADGKTFEGCESDNFIVETDVPGLLPEFLDQIRGMKGGEEKTINFIYPEKYFNKEVAGKKGEFLVIVKEVRKKILPEINDDFAKNFGSFKSLSELKDDIRKKLELTLSAREQARIERESALAVSAKNEFEIPGAMISFHLNQILDEYSEQLKKQNKTLKDVNFNSEQFVRENYDEGLLRSKWYVLSESIAEQEKLEATKEDVEERIKFLCNAYKKKDEEVRPKEGSSSWDSMCRSIRSGKAMKFVIDHAKVEMISADPEKEVEEKLKKDGKHKDKNVKKGKEKTEKKTSAKSKK